MLAAVAWALLATGVASAGPYSTPNPPPDCVQGSPSAFELSAAIETRRDRFSYRFENPSSFDTVDLVPHFFRQSYVADNEWLTVRARYRLGRLCMGTELSVSPDTSTYGDDFDTFFQPDGDTVTVGTAGDVSMRSLRVSQRFRIAGTPTKRLFLRYVFRRDRSEFLPAVRTVTHTRPPSEEATFVSTREATVSDVHELRLGFEKAWTLSGGWRLELGAELAPAALARLTTRLPDKYPGQDIVFSALVGSAVARVSVKRVAPRWYAEISADADRTWSYSSSDAFTREALGAVLKAGYRW